jgi:hypothetical protein
MWWLLHANRAPGTIHAYQAVSEEINRSLGLVTPSLCISYPVQGKPTELFSQKRAGLLDHPCLSKNVPDIREPLKREDAEIFDLLGASSPNHCPYLPAALR